MRFSHSGAFMFHIILFLACYCDKASSSSIFDALWTRRLQTGDTEETKHYEILIIGNSYSGGLNGHLQFLLNSADGYSGRVRALGRGGAKLSGHAVDWEGSILDTETFDYVIIQDQSQVPSFIAAGVNEEFEASRDGAIVLDERIEATGAETIFFMTWGRRSGDARNPWINPDFLTMQSNLERGYNAYAEAITTDTRTPYIGPVGLAFQKIYEDIVAEGGDPLSEGELFHSLYSGDGSHQGQYGSYLAACVFFTTITGESSIGMPDNLGIDDYTRLRLQQAADFVVLENSEYQFPWSNNDGTSPVPSESPSEAPSEAPSDSPSAVATSQVPEKLSTAPTVVAAMVPTQLPTGAPTAISPSSQSSNMPTSSPSFSGATKVGGCLSLTLLLISLFTI
mmetsp:Transcript_34068/g.82643  ORF Transcript_34068/g.82643 Transcript_34068/m.82643 type:complete len:395 (+) Transcript_34068:65-1249(+)